VGEEEYGTVAFSDECYVYMDDRHGRVYVTRREDEAWDEDCIVPTFKQSSVRVMVWGCIIKGQKGPLVVLEYPGGKGGGMTAARYQEQVLDCVLMDFLDEMKVKKGDVIFQQDNATSHKAKQTQNWFKAHGIKLLFHPANSPDLNAIKHVWHELKCRLCNLPHHPTNVEQLKEVMQRIWDEIDIEDIDKCIDRMPQVVEALRKAKGGHTKF
jgi:hypothetical protein